MTHHDSVVLYLAQHPEIARRQFESKHPLSGSHGSEPALGDIRPEAEPASAARQAAATGSGAGVSIPFHYDAASDADYFGQESRATPSCVLSTCRDLSPVYRPSWRSAPRHHSAMTKVILQSSITCPECGHVTSETTPTDACQWFHECRNCKTILHPKPGDCCVFCSYGTIKCPPVQQVGGCCGD